MHTRFRILAFVLSVSGLAAAQDKPEQKKPEPKVTGLKWTASELAKFGFSLRVGVRQEPPRLGPGQTGRLILILPSKGYWGPRGKSNDRGIYARFSFRPQFRITCDQTSGPVLVFANQAKWDPPKDQHTTYQDMVVIRIPIAIDSNAKYGLHAVKGTIEVSGTMREPVSLFGGKPRNTPENRYLKKLGVQTGTVEFSGKVKVGKPMPKALPAMVSNERNHTAEPTDASAKRKTAVPSPRNTSGPGAKPVEREHKEPSRPDAPTRTPDSDRPAKPSVDVPIPGDGFPFEWLAAAVVLALAVLLLVKARGQ